MCFVRIPGGIKDFETLQLTSCTAFEFEMKHNDDGNAKKVPVPFQAPFPMLRYVFLV